jgi:hypothetical protein
LTATSVDHAHVSLSWPTVTNAATYRVTRNALPVGTTSGTTYTDALLWPQSSYDYRVEAVSSSGAVLSTGAVAGVTLPLPAGGFPSPFAATSLWNRPLPASPTLHPNNAAIMSNWVAKYIRTPNMTLHSWGVAVAEAQPSNKAYNVPCTMYSCTLSAYGAFRIPPTAKQDPAGDGHLAIHDPAAKREWGMWEAGYSAAADAWTSSAGAAVSLDGNGIAPKGKASSNAANFPLLGGLIRPEEILQGRIDHALVFGQPSIAPGPPVCPATANIATGSDPLSLREGTQLQLDPTINVDALALPAWQKTVAKALQKYGMYLRDNSGTLSIYAENPIGRGYDAWQKVGLSGGSVGFSSAFPWNKLRVIYAPDC